MIRTIEVLFVIIILAGAFITVSYFTVLPSSRQISPINLRMLSFTTLQTLDSNYDLSRAAFETGNVTVWSGVQVALSASLPPNVVYNLTVYDVNDQQGQVYNYITSISNAASQSSISDVATYAVASSNVTFNFTPEKIGESSGGTTLYILNCSDANGWWITGYTAQSLAQDLYNLLSPYFTNTVMVQNTVQLRQLIDNQTISGSPTERVQNAVVINTLGESVPMPSEYYQGNSRGYLGYDAGAPSGYNYVKYCWTLGNTVRMYNWTWASIVGYPFYYVSNNAVFSGSQNNWGIYGMKMNSQGGSRAFLQGLDNQSYAYDSSSVVSDVGGVTLTNQAIEYTNYYGIYPSAYQTSTRALANSILASYHLSIGFNVFNPVIFSGQTYNPGAIYNHKASGSSNITGSLLALGLTRTPDVRVTGLSLLSYYQPRLYASQYTTSGTTRLVTLQLGLVGSG